MVAVMLLAIGGIADATVATKQIKVNYNNATLYANGKLVNVSAAQEPFLLNGVTYVPLRVAGEALNSFVNWDAATKSIRISSGATTEVTSLKAQITQKDQEIATLKTQIAALQKQLNEKTNLTDLEDNLIDDYDSLKDVSIKDITLDGNKDNVDVEIAVDLGRYDSEWADLTDRNIENWLDDLVGDIQNELTSNTVVEGVIINTDDDKNLVKFSKDGKDDLVVTFRDSSYRGGDAAAVEDALVDETYSVGQLDFTVSSVDYDEADDEAKVYLDAEDNNCSIVWAGLTNSTIKGYVESICSDIAGVYDDEDVNLDTLRVYFYDEDNSLLNSFKYDVGNDTLY